MTWCSVEIWGVEDDNGGGFDGSNSDDDIRGTNENDIIAGYEGGDALTGRQGKTRCLDMRVMTPCAQVMVRITCGAGMVPTICMVGLGKIRLGMNRMVRIYCFKSDQFAENWLYGQAGNSTDGGKTDILKLGGIRLFVQGVETSELSFSRVSNFTGPTGNFSGIGIFANGFIEALYIGGDLSAAPTAVDDGRVAV